MKKILYVEDELKANISNIISLFKRHLNDEIIQKLSMGDVVYPDEIKRLVETTDLIEVEYLFPNALQKVIQQPEKYDLFLIDRNLGEYNIDEVKQILKKIALEYSAEEQATYKNRQGDYLLRRLVFGNKVKREELTQRFYFFTANDDKTRGDETIEMILREINFSQDNFVIKRGKKYEDLKKIINDIDGLNLKIENRIYLDILRKNVDDKTKDNFLTLLKEKDQELTKERIKYLAGCMRDIYQEILRICADKGKISKMRLYCEDKHGNIIMGKETIEWLFNNGYITHILKSFFYSISKNTSVLLHPNPEYPTINTINSLIYALKDIILWFGKLTT